MKIFRVKANNVSHDRGIILTELGRPANVGEEFDVTEERLDNLVNGNNKYRVAFAELIAECKELQPEAEMEKPSKALKEKPIEIPEQPIIEEAKPKRGRKPKK